MKAETTHLLNAIKKDVNDTKAESAALLKSISGRDLTVRSLTVVDDDGTPRITLGIEVWPTGNRSTVLRNREKIN